MNVANYTFIILPSNSLICTRHKTQIVPGQWCLVQDLIHFFKTEIIMRWFLLGHGNWNVGVMLQQH